MKISCTMLHELFWCVKHGKESQKAGRHSGFWFITLYDLVNALVRINNTWKFLVLETSYASVLSFRRWTSEKINLSDCLINCHPVASKEIAFQFKQCQKFTPSITTPWKHPQRPEVGLLHVQKISRKNCSFLLLLLRGEGKVTFPFFFSMR